MLANGIRQTTTTTGTGAVTLATVAGAVPFAQPFPLNFPFAYSFLDISGNVLEEGVGYLSSSTVLVRAKVLSTWNGTTYNKDNPTAVSLTGTTTVICTPVAATTESMMATVDGNSTGVNRFISPANRNLSATTVTVTALRCYYVPFLVRQAGPITSISINVQTAGAGGSVARAGIYAQKADGYMGAQLATTGDLATDSTGVKTGTLSTPVSLPPGMYFVAVVCSGAPVLGAWSSAVSNLIGGSPLGFSSGGVIPIEYRYETLGSVILPSTAAGTTTAVQVGVSHIPSAYLGVT